MAFELKPRTIACVFIFGQQVVERNPFFPERVGVRKLVAARVRVDHLPPHLALLAHLLAVVPAQDDVRLEHAEAPWQAFFADELHLLHDGRELIEPVGENNVAFVVAAIPERVLDARKKGPAFNLLNDAFIKIFRGDTDVCVHIDAVIVLRKYNPGVRE